MEMVAQPSEEVETSDNSNSQDKDEKCWPPWCPNWRIFTLQFSLTVGDMGTDLKTAWNYFQNCNYLYCFLTLFFVVLQSLPIAVEFLKNKISEIRAGELKLTPFHLKSKSLFCGVSYLVLISLLFVYGGFILLSVFQILQTVILLLRLCWQPPGKKL